MKFNREVILPALGDLGEGLLYVDEDSDLILVMEGEYLQIRNGEVTSVDPGACGLRRALGRIEP